MHMLGKIITTKILEDGVKLKFLQCLRCVYQ